MPEDFDVFPPNCYDRADGSHGVGVATPAAARKIKPSGIFFEESSTSPEIERGEQATIVHTFRCDTVTGFVILTSIGRGTFQTDSFGNVTRVLTTRMNWQKGDTCEIQITAESISFDTPPDEFDVDVLELNPPLERHPIFRTLLNYNINSSGEIVAGAKTYGPQIINLLKSSVNAVSIGSFNDLQSFVLSSTSITDAAILTLATKFAKKLLVGEDEFYLPGLKVTWSQFFFLPPPMNGGGYVEDPVLHGGLPPYFWSSTGLPGGANTIVDFLGFFNPRIYTDGISWLRLADTRAYNRTWHKLTRTWIGGPLGLWDTDIYPNYFIA